MREVDYSQIALGMESSPSFGQQLQGGMIDRFAALLKALTNDSNLVVIIHGCVMTKVGNQYDQTAGVVYYQGNIYTVDVFSGNHATQIPVYVLDNTYTRQAWYGDSAKRDTFFNRKLRLQLGASGSGLANYNQAVLFQDKLSEFIELQIKIDDAIDALNTALTSAINLKANANNAALTGIPTAPTAAPGTNTTQLATTAFVQAMKDSLIASAPGLLDTLDEIAAALNDDPNFHATITALINARVPQARIIAAGLGLSGGGDLSADRTLNVLVDDVGIEINGDFLRLKDSGVTSAKLGAASVTDAKLAEMRVKSVGVQLLIKEIPIGDWNMDTTQFVSIAHGVTLSKIRTVTVEIYNDAGDTLFNFNEGSGSIQKTSTNITITRTTSGFFDGALFDSTSFNRGWIKVEYEA